MLQVGALAGTGLVLPDLLRARAAAGNPPGPAASSAGSFGKARSCILLFMFGGPSQLETWDPKPDALAEYRGEFSAADTNVPGTRICQLLPRLARLADQYAIVRNVAHRNVAHGPACHTALSGMPHPIEADVDTPASSKDAPAFGALLGKLRPPARALPSFVMVPDLMSNEGKVPGQAGGYLGRSFDPLVIRADPNDPSFAGGELARPQQTVAELARRQNLLPAFNQAARWAEAEEPRLLDQHFAKAFNLLSGTDTSRALNIGAEPDRVRERYGRSTFGQSCLLARRLVEAGVGMVTVNFSASLTVPLNWDTHAVREGVLGDKPINVVKNKLLPITDWAVSALLEDLSTRGLLDETLVVCMGEFGRTPKLAANGGRDHWPNCYSIMLAGGGIRGGHVHGRSDRIAAYPMGESVGPCDIGATLLHCLGVAPHREVKDVQGRPLAASIGQPVSQLLR